MGFMSRTVTRTQRLRESARVHPRPLRGLSNGMLGILMAQNLRTTAGATANIPRGFLETQSIAWNLRAPTSMRSVLRIKRPAISANVIHLWRVVLLCLCHSIRFYSCCFATLNKNKQAVKVIEEDIGVWCKFQCKLGFKSLRITNTEMCVAKPAEKCKMINRKKLGKTLKTALTKAKVERRLVCGLFPAIAHLEKTPEEVVLCVLPTTRPGDTATHIQAVLLQAFCYENYIPVIQVDSSEKLASYCGVVTNVKDASHCNCAIITRDVTLPMTDDAVLPMSDNEQFLTDFYECTLEEFPRPIIQLPI